MTSPDELPDSPFTMLTAMAVQHHELFTGWVNAGFSEEQAFQLLLTVISSAIASMNGGGRA